MVNFRHICKENVSEKHPLVCDLFAGENFKELHNAIYQPHRSIASSASQAEGREFESRFPLIASSVKKC